MEKKIYTYNEIKDFVLNQIKTNRFELWWASDLHLDNNKLKAKLVFAPDMPGIIDVIKTEKEYNVFKKSDFRYLKLRIYADEHFGVGYNDMTDDGLIKYLGRKSLYICDHTKYDNRHKICFNYNKKCMYITDEILEDITNSFINYLIERGQYKDEKEYKMMA